MLFCGHSPFFIRIANVVTTVDAMAVGVISTASGLDTTTVSVFLLLINQKARNSDYDWFIQLSDNRSPTTVFRYWKLSDVRLNKNRSNLREL